MNHFFFHFFYLLALFKPLRKGFTRIRVKLGSKKTRELFFLKRMYTYFFVDHIHYAAEGVSCCDPNLPHPNFKYMLRNLFFLLVSVARSKFKTFFCCCRRWRIQFCNTRAGKIILRPIRYYNFRRAFLLQPGTLLCYVLFVRVMRGLFFREYLMKIIILEK